MTKDELIELAQVGMGIHSPNAPEYIVCEALIKALAQPEPLPWINKMSIDVPNQPLYTAPQRTWVGLTDEEVSQLAHHELWVKNFIRQVEAKLRSKNI